MNAPYCPLGKTARDKYMAQRRGAKQRGISWEITFEEWLAIWLGSGHWRERGGNVHPLGYVMGRFGDSGPYRADNVHIITHAQNSRDCGTYRQARKAAPMPERQTA